MARLSKDERKVEEFLEELEAFMHLLKNEFELYFLGLVKTAPDDKFRELRRRIADLDQLVIMNTGQNFKRKTLRSRYNTMSLYWQRTLQQIELGTYSRMRRRVAFREAEQRKLEADNALKAEREAAARALLARRGDTPAGPATPPPPAARAWPKESEALFRAYVDARRATGEAVLGLTAERLRQTLASHEEGIKRKFGCAEVTYRVSVENGKATIKAIPKK